ncbi:MAG: SpoIIE family protein phosphatase [Acidimicrobiia bacterium]|nr:SpoIIE family protein phosphatase [Acidimicrobiia bacterium]
MADERLATEDSPVVTGDVGLLAEAARAVHGGRDLASKLSWVAEAGRSLTGASFAAYVASPTEGGGVQLVVGCPRYVVEEFASAAAALLFAGVAAGHPGVCVGDIRDGTRFRGLRPYAGFDQVVSYLAVPVLGADGIPYGALLLGHPGPDRFDKRAQSAVTALGAHLGAALDNLRTVNRLAELEATQREVVHQLQEAVRPVIPEVDAAELGVHYLPAEPSAPTGGDLYDWVVLPDGALHLVVVDVVGKGVAATKDALCVTHALRLLALDGCPMSRLASRADGLVSAQSPDLAATALIARYHPEDGTVELAGAGHPPALVVSPEGKARFVDAPGIPIGWPGAGSDEVVSFTLERSDVLVLYTDGLVEATKDIIDGLDALAAAAGDAAGYPAGPLARALVERALSGAMRNDDSLALVLRRRTPTSGPRPRTAPFEYQFSPNAVTVPLARGLFGDWLENLGVDPSAAEDLLLMVSELCTNAVRFSSGAPGALSVRARGEGDAVIVEVSDDGLGFDWHPVAEAPDPGADEGRGLFLVGALADELDVTRFDGRTVVRAVKRAVLPPA